MAKPVQGTGAFATTPFSPPTAAKADPSKPRNAFELLGYPKEPKKTAPCQMQSCREMAYLIVGKTTCEKCQKVFCRTHYPRDKHECNGM